MVYPHRQGEIATTTFFKQGIETATFHILTPYPTTALYERMAQQGRLFHSNWDLYDTRHVVYRPAKLAPEALEAGYWRAYRDFYRWGSIFQGAWMKESWNDRLRHMPDAAGWKKFEPAWDLIIGRKCNVLDGWECGLIIEREQNLYQRCFCNTTWRGAEPMLPYPHVFTLMGCSETTTRVSPGRSLVLRSAPPSRTQRKGARTIFAVSLCPDERSISPSRARTSHRPYYAPSRSSHRP